MAGRPTIAVVDYCKGNLKSVERALAAAGGNAVVTDDPLAMVRADAIVLPGVGAFADASDAMQRSGQMQAIREWIEAGNPFLGICLGLHLLFEEGTEGVKASECGDTGKARGLAVLPGTVERMPETDRSGKACKVPHVGWNALTFDKAEAGPLLSGIEPGTYFYFTHSYLAPDNPCTVATTVHSRCFPSIVRYRDRAFGIQFHAEKSSDAGLRLFRNFVALAEKRSYST